MKNKFLAQTILNTDFYNHHGSKNLGKTDNALIDFFLYKKKRKKIELNRAIKIKVRRDKVTSNFCKNKTGRTKIEHGCVGLPGKPMWGPKPPW